MVESQTKAEILADSVSLDGYRLTTFLIIFPRICLAQVLTHRVFSRNTSSSRAIPIRKLIAQVWERPFVPSYVGENCAGMHSKQEVGWFKKKIFKTIWKLARIPAIISVFLSYKLNIHKQLPNRLLEPWLYVTMIVSATEFNNFFNLRCFDDAQPEIQELALAMLKAYQSSKPKLLDYGQWHLPFADRYADGFDNEKKVKVSAGRCARASYQTFFGEISPEKDCKLHDQLLEDVHCSPLEHQAYPIENYDMMLDGNFVGYRQHRKDCPNENQRVLKEQLR
jgi:hypothetical protein